MRFRTQTDGDKFRVQQRFWFWWARGAYPPKRFNTKQEAVAWISDRGFKQVQKPKWRTI